MSRQLDDLDSKFKALAMALIARCAEAGVPVQIIFTGRTQEEQAELYAQGRAKPGKIVTWTLNSKHVMKPPDFKSLAIDICPWEVYTSAPGNDKLLWDITNAAWEKIGGIGEQLGLIWGGRWKQKDYSHFEMLSEKEGRPGAALGTS